MSLRTASARLGLLGLGLTFACTAAEPAPPPIEVVPGYEFAQRFVGTVVDGRMTIEAMAEDGSGLHSTVRVVKTGAPGGNPALSIELVTTSVGDDVAGCGAPDTHCGDVLMRSFYPGRLSDIWVRILRTWPATGFEAANSDPDTSGHDFNPDGLGLWSYGDLDPNQTRSKTWVFNQPSQATFRFYGEVRARVSAPVVVAGTLTLPGSSSVRRAFQDSSSIAYLAAGAGGVQIADVTNPPTPNVLGAYTEPGMDCTDLTKIGDQVYAASGAVGVKIVNVSNPGNPTLTGTIPVAGAVTVASIGTALYVGVGGDVEIWNVANPLSPVFVGLLGANNASTIVRVVVDGFFIYCLYRNGQVFVANGTGNPLGPVPVAAIAAFAGNATDLVVRNGIAYCAYNGGPGVGGLLIADWRSPLSPQTIFWDGGSAATGIAVFGRTLACIYGDGRFVTVALDDLANPRVINSSFTPGAPTGVAVLWNGFGLCAYGSQVQLIDTPPYVVKTMPIQGSEGVCPDDDVQVFFSATLDPASVTGSTVRVLSSGVPVAGSLSVSQNLVTFDPAGVLAPGEYEIEVTGGVRNVRGTAAAPYDGSFTASSLCIDWITAPTTVTSGSPMTFQFNAAGVGPATTGRVRMSLDDNPTDRYVPATLLPATQTGTEYAVTQNAPTVTAPTTYYVVPELVIGLQRVYGPIRSFVVNPAPVVQGCGGLPANLGTVAPLQNATATFSQSGFSVAAAIDGSTVNNTGWAISPSIVNQTAAFETASNTPSYVTGTRLVFQINNTFPTEHALGKFRLAGTTAARTEFADGLASSGNVGLPAIWSVLTPSVLCASNGANMTLNPDGSILVQDMNSTNAVYTIVVDTAVTGFTGFRLEALEDPALPFNGPGLQNVNGNFVVAEFTVRQQSQGQEVTSTGLVLHLDAGDPASYPGSGSTWSDLSPSNLDATLGGVSYVTEFGGGLRTAGNAFPIVVPASSAWSMSPASAGNTLELWWRKGSVTTHGGHLVGTYPANGGTWQIFQNAVGYSPVEPFAMLLYANGSTPQYWISGTTHQLDEVAHLVVVQDGQAFTFYKNGVFAGSQMRSSFNESGSRSLVLGSNSSGGETAIATYYQVRWYGRTLTPAEISANFQATRAKFGL